MEQKECHVQEKKMSAPKNEVILTVSWPGDEINELGIFSTEFVRNPIHPSMAFAGLSEDYILIWYSGQPTESLLKGFLGLPPSFHPYFLTASKAIYNSKEITLHRPAHLGTTQRSRQTQQIRWKKEKQLNQSAYMLCKIRSVISAK